MWNPFWQQTIVNPHTRTVLEETLRPQHKYVCSKSLGNSIRINTIVTAADKDGDYEIYHDHHGDRHTRQYH